LLFYYFYYIYSVNKFIWTKRVLVQKHNKLTYTRSYYKFNMVYDIRKNVENIDNTKYNIKDDLFLFNGHWTRI